jgi:hypothetical protein
VDTIALALVLRPPLGNSSGQILEHSDGAFPVNAGISDGNTLLESTGAFSGNLLIALVDIRLDHDSNDACLALAELVSNDLGDLGLVTVVFVGVA